jgi:AcrR family transcriptional regulator
MATETGLRARKKQQTRRLISRTAWDLFAERGFERVTVAEVARAAEVSEATVFNYFKTKEALVFDDLEAFGAAVLSAVRDRSPGETAVAAFGRFLLERSEYGASAEVGDIIAVTARMVAGSPTLRARQAEIFDGQAYALAGLLAAEIGAGPDDPEPLAAAHALMGVHRTMLHATRQAALAGQRGPRLVATIADRLQRALAVVTDGLDHYAKRTTAGTD